jgi:AAA+ superfamily predicted ATPase
MNPHQLRERGRELFGVWIDCVSGSDPRENVDWDQLTGPNVVALLQSLAEQSPQSPPQRATALDRRIGWLADTLGLDQVEKEILLILARCAVHEEWEKLIRILPGSGHNPSVRRISLVSKLRMKEIDKRLGVGSKLWSSGLVEDDRDSEFSANRLLQRIAWSSSLPPQLARQLMPAAPRSTLNWADFSHIGPQRDIAEKLVATDHPAAILLHGPPGTGKTEFARLLADRTGKRAVFAGLQDENGQEPRRNERLAHLSVLRALTRGDPSRLIVMDEADDILLLGHFEERGHRSKLFLNRLVEEGLRPTIWIVNSPRALEESLLRRMSLAIEFPLPPLGVRRRVVERHARHARMKLALSEIERLAALQAAPAVVGKALASAKAVGGGANEAMVISEGLITTILGRPPSPESLPPCYDSSLAVADVDLVALSDKLVEAPSRGWSLLLAGPSGTGKSAYARHLAERLGIDLLVKRGSDLLDMYVGGTEANIASAFREAALGRCLLLIDEADDFLADRRDAVRSWERSMVNQMLREMESLEAPFVATTNAPQLLDPATQRRFTMRAIFVALDHQRAAEQFRRWFECEVPRGEHLFGSTPGDFALVANRAKLLGVGDPHQLLDWLRQEAAHRGDGRRTMGFVP